MQQQHMQSILQHLFQVSSLDDVPRQRLESFVEDYPSFGIGHYLLSRKLKSEGAGSYATETQRTGLYFTNPFWLQWQLDNIVADGQPAWTGEPAATFDRPVVAEDTVVAEGAEAVEEPDAIAEQAVALHKQPAAPEAPAVADESEPVLEPSTQAPNNIVAIAEESFAVSADDDLAEALSEVRPEEVTLEEEQNMTAGEGEAIEGEPVPLAGAAGAGNGISAADLLLRSIEEARGLRETLHKINNDPGAEIAAAGESLSVETGQPIRDEEPPFVLEEAGESEVKESVAPTESMATPEAIAGPESLAPPESVGPTESMATPEPLAPAESDTVPEAAAPPNSPASPAPPAEPVAQPEPELVFEPYHTIDYFASQGIKLTPEDNPTDALGKQLKSFTDWLKSMRRVKQKDREVIPDRVAEQAVMTSAAHSIEGRDVLTEAMAEVLAKQGMRERARAVYEKLSLLNPDKRTYFAAKIEQLNIP